MPIGFEIVFPAMMKNAEALGLALPYNAAFVTAIEAERQKKLKKSGRSHGNTQSDSVYFYDVTAVN